MNPAPNNSGSIRFDVRGDSGPRARNEISVALNRSCGRPKIAKRIEKLRAAMAGSTMWRSTGAVAARAGVKSNAVIDVLRELERMGEIEGRCDPCGSHEMEWRSRTKESKQCQSA